MLQVLLVILKVWQHFFIAVKINNAVYTH